MAGSHVLVEVLRGVGRHVGVVLRAEAHAVPESLFVESGADPW